MVNPNLNRDYDAQTDDNSDVRARFYSDIPGEVVVKKNGDIHLFAEGNHAAVSMDAAEDIAALLDHVSAAVDNSDTGSDTTMMNISAFCGVFKLLGDIGENQYLSPPETAYGDEE